MTVKATEPSDPKIISLDFEAPYIEQVTPATDLLSTSNASSKDGLYEVNSVEWLLEQLRLALAIRRDDIMLSALNRLFAIDENNLDGLFYQANRYLLLEDIINAQVVMNKLNLLAPDSLQAQNLSAQLSLQNDNKQAFQSARLLARAGRYEEAVTAYDRLFPDGIPTARLTLEYLTLEGKLSSRWESVKQKLMALNKAYPDTPDFQLVLADHLAKQELNNPWMLATYERLSLRSDIGLQAALSWIQALDALPISDELVEKYAFIASYYPSDLVINQAATEAVSRLERETLLRQDPTYVAKLTGLLFLETSNTDLAAKKLTYALTTRPQDVEILGGLGLVALRRGQHQQALALFKQAQANESDPDKASKWQSLIDTATYWGLLAQGDRALAKKQYQTAQAYYQQAIKRQPSTAEGLNRLAQLYVMKKHYSSADKLYRHVLQYTPLNQVALEGRIEVLLLQNQSLNSLLKQYSPTQQQIIQPKLAALKIDKLNNELQRALKGDDLNTAQTRLETLLALDDGSPWQAFDLANALVRLGQKSRADALMKQWTIDAMGDKKGASDRQAEWQFAYGLYLSGQGQTEAAINMLNKIALDQRTPAMKANLTRLKVDEAVLRIKQTWADNPQQARLVLAELERTYRDDIDVQITLAALWLALENNETQRENHQKNNKGQQLLSQLQPELGWENSTQIRYGELLLQAQDVKRFDDWLKQWQPQALSQTEKNKRAVLIQQKYIQQAEQAFSKQDYQQANGFYAQAMLQKGPLLQDAQLGQLQSNLALNHREKANALSDKLYQAREQLTSKQGVLLAELLAQQGYHEQARVMLNVLHQRDNLDAMGYRDLMKIALDIEDKTLINNMAENALYRNELESKEQAAVARPPLRSLYDNADDNWLTRNVKTDIDKVQARDDGHIAFGLDYGGRDGANNFTQIPIEARIPVPDYHGHLLLRLDQVHLASGDIRYYDKALDENTVVIDQTDIGTALGMGWEADNWLVDLGVTPIGFHHMTWVGGALVQGELPGGSWTGVASRRALTSTILSYGGLSVPQNTSDPAGTPWGGVVSSGGKFNTSFDDGGPFGVWSSVQYHHITGVDVADNTRLGVLTGGYYKWIATEDERLSSGVTLMHLQYDKNVSEYTLTHGGYYSPQSYFSVALPVNYYGRYQDTWAYWLRASVSQSWSQEDGPYLTSLSDSSGGGFGYSILGALEKRVSKRWYLGVSVDIERSDFYEPNHFILYARYTFNDRWQAIPTPPTPPILYSEFD